MDNLFKDVTREFVESVLLIETNIHDITDHVLSEDERERGCGHEFDQVEEEMISDTFAFMGATNWEEFSGNEVHIFGQESKLSGGQMSQSKRDRRMRKDKRRSGKEGSRGG
jgi:hypothetical protein